MVLAETAKRAGYWQETDFAEGTRARSLPLGRMESPQSFWTEGCSDMFKLFPLTTMREEDAGARVDAKKAVGKLLQ